MSSSEAMEARESSERVAYGLGTLVEAFVRQYLHADRQSLQPTALRVGVECLEDDRTSSFLINHSGYGY
jgi:hypothetical protein